MWDHKNERWKDDLDPVAELERIKALLEKDLDEGPDVRVG